MLTPGRRSRHSILTPSRSSTSSSRIASPAPSLQKAQVGGIQRNESIATVYLIYPLSTLSLLRKHYLDILITSSWPQVISETTQYKLTTVPNSIHSIARDVVKRRRVSCAGFSAGLGYACEGNRVVVWPVGGNNINDGYKWVYSK